MMEIVEFRVTSKRFILSTIMYHKTHLIPRAMVFMKAGFHSGETLTDIIERKVKEEAEAGVIMWGYGGTLCHPTKQICQFVEICKVKGLPISVVMSSTPSKFNTALTIAEEFSEDGKIWQPVPLGVKVTASRYALVMRDLKLCQMELDLGSYVVAYGPSEGRRLSEYIRGRVDKGCATYEGPICPKKPILTVLTATLVYPYAVFIR